MKAELKEQETQYQDIFVDQLAKILCDPKGLNIEMLGLCHLAS